MTDRKTYRTIIEAVALGDGETAGRLNAELDGVGHQRLFEYTTAVLSLCLERRFDSDASLEAIRAFANELRLDYSHLEPPVKQLAVEGVIRGFGGEEHLLDEVPIEHQLNVQYPMIRKIVADSEALQSELGELLAEAETMLAEWERTE